LGKLVTDFQRPASKRLEPANRTGSTYLRSANFLLFWFALKFEVSGELDD
jgi:hypothetical protein